MPAFVVDDKNVHIWNIYIQKRLLLESCNFLGIINFFGGNALLNKFFFPQFV